MSSIINDIKQNYKIGGVANKLIYWNVALFVFPYVFFALLSFFKLNIAFLNYVSLDSNPKSLIWKPWSIVTYGFFHADFFHIFFNMLVFSFSSRLFLTFFTQKQLLSLFFSGIIFSGIIYILCYLLFPSLANINVQLIGASGAIMCVLFATTSYSPMREIKLLFLGYVKLWHIAFTYLVLDLIALPFDNTGGHIAHLGGALFGFLFIKQIQNGVDITNWFTITIDWFSNLFSTNKKTNFKKIHRNPKPEIKIKPISKIVTKSKTQQQIDEILDKISKSGYDSLSQNEKEFLFKAGS